MNEYQIIVSSKGCFLFRTEWDDALDAAASTA